MKKKMSTKGMMILAVGIAMASCSKNDVFEQNQTNFSEQQKAEYVSNFVAKYGQPDANQSWDFAAAVPNASKTRAGETMVCDPSPNPMFFYEHIFDDIIFPLRSEILRKINSAPEKKWNPYLKAELYPSAVHTKDKKLKFGLSVCYNSEVTNIVTGFKSDNNDWGYNLDKLADYAAGSVFSVGRNVDTRSLTTAENVYWAAYNYNYEWTWGFLWGEWQQAGMSEFKLEKYKEITLHGHTYWCFDCTGDGDYSNLICLAVDAETQAIQKRYFVEDLGSKDDFDFNDIVFDVIDDNGSQKCIIRAMGGTLDFTLNIGNTTWTKSVEGVKKDYKVGTMYNTQGTIEYDKVLAEFPVTGWNPETNNISVDVKSNVSENVIVKIPFPKKGEVPMILAFKTVTDWQTERESLPEGWWFTPIEISED